MGIRELSFKERSLLFAKLAFISYNNAKQVKSQAKKLLALKSYEINIFNSSTYIVWYHFIDRIENTSKQNISYLDSQIQQKMIKVISRGIYSNSQHVIYK